MANKVTFDYSKATGFIQEHEMQYMSELAAQAKEKLVSKSGAGNDFVGWVDLPVDYDKEEFANTYYIQTAADLKLSETGHIDNVGITAGASTPKKIIEEVQKYVRTKL